MSEVHAYPLSWPVGWKRTSGGARKHALFSRGERVYSNTPGGSSWMRRRDLTVSDGTTRILDELGRMDVPARKVIISTNVQLRNDGLPRSGQREPEDPGAAVYWNTRNGEQRVMAIDMYTKVADNLAAIAATLEALRAIERHGGAAILDRAFTGFVALPAPVSGQKPWRQVFGFGAEEDVSKVRLEGAYRTARSDAHPDREGGSHEAFLAVQDAYAKAQRELGFTP